MLFKYHPLTQHAPAIAVYIVVSNSKGNSESEIAYTHRSNSQPLLSQQKFNFMGCAQACMYSHNPSNTSNTRDSTQCSQSVLQQAYGKTELVEILFSYKEYNDVQCVYAFRNSKVATVVEEYWQQYLW